jgi:hypothetical protein
MWSAGFGLTVGLLASIPDDTSQENPRASRPQHGAHKSQGMPHPKPDHEGVHLGRGFLGTQLMLQWLSAFEIQVVCYSQDVSDITIDSTVLSKFKFMKILILIPTATTRIDTQNSGVMDMSLQIYWPG